MKEINILNIDGFKIGHAHNEKGYTGCTVIISEEGATGGVAVRGGAPGTRETDLLDPMELVNLVNAVVLSGGSAFGLDASSGVMEYLENKDIGYDVGVAKVPIVCQAVLFDLAFGDSRCRPDKKMGLDACINSETLTDSQNGNIGAGYGATVGKIFGPSYAMKGGLGTYALTIGDLQVGAVVAVNCLGDVVNPEDPREILAGAFNPETKSFINTEAAMIDNYNKFNNPFNGNTTIGCIITNANFNKAQANKIASMAHNAYGRTMRPAHTMFDGDTIFTLSSNKVEADVTLVGMLATTVMEKAIINAVKNADSLLNIPSFKNFL